MKRKSIKFALLLMVTPLVLSSCLKEELIEGGNGLDDWTSASHGYGATPDYSTVFNQNQVQRLDFVIEADYWQAMQDDIESIYGGMTGGPGGSFSDETPVYVPTQMYFNGKQWYDVGLRYKGNSSLKSAYTAGNGKLPFRIEMNHFENENPNINGQTFYGFTQLSLSSNYKDESYLHEKVAADVFRDFGVPAPQTAFYRIYIDYGDGPVYFGLYTMVEVVFDTPMLNAQFGGTTGNCYKPDGEGAKLNDPSQVTSTYFINKTYDNYVGNDASNLVDALLSDDRLNNPSQWRSNLEQYIDMDLYLKYLAANMTMKNWDTYGRMTHNYYLYNDPAKNKLVWIPWDNNETFSDGGMGPLSFDFSDLSTTPLSSTGDVAWPLLSYIYDDAVYKAQYDANIDDFITSAFSSSTMNSRFTTAHNLIQPYVNGTDGEINGYTHTTSSDFSSSLSELINYVSTRISEADAYTP